MSMKVLINNDVCYFSPSEQCFTNALGGGETETGNVGGNFPVLTRATKTALQPQRPMSSDHDNVPHEPTADLRCDITERRALVRTASSACVILWLVPVAFTRLLALKHTSDM